MSEAPEWVPQAVLTVVEQLNAGVSSRGYFRLHAALHYLVQADRMKTADAHQVLHRLIRDERMEAVWRLLYQRKYIDRKRSAEFKYPACVTNSTLALRLLSNSARREKEGKFEEAELLNHEAALLKTSHDEPLPLQLSEQDVGVQLLFLKVLANWTSSDPIMASDLKSQAAQLEQIAQRLRSDAQVLTSHHARLHKQLLRLAADCEDEAHSLFPWRPRDQLISALRGKSEIDDPGVFQHAKGSMTIKAFMAAVCTDTVTIFGSALYSTVATIANVAYDRTDQQRSSVISVWQR